MDIFPEPNTDLRNSETLSLKESIYDCFRRDVLLNAPNAWIDYNKTKVGYGIPFNCHFYRYEPPCEWAELKGVEEEILDLLRKVTA